MPKTADPTQIVESLDATTIRQELAELRGREALRVLLRTAIARDRQRVKQRQAEQGGRRDVSL